jgi:hypothetical protein
LAYWKFEAPLKANPRHGVEYKIAADALFGLTEATRTSPLNSI